MEAAKDDAEDDAIAVESVKAINETTIEVTLPEGFKATEADLVGKTITVKAGDKTLTATYSENSLDKEGKALFTLTGEDKLQDAVEYTVAADWAKFAEDTFVAETKAAHIAKFVKVTDAVPATTKENEKTPSAKIVVAGEDQYGKEYSLTNVADVTVTGTLNGMPLKVTEEINYDKGTVVVTKALKEGDKLAFTLTTKVDKEEVKSTIEYTVAAAEEAKVKEIKLVAKDNKVSVASGKEVELTATAFDQFKSPIEKETLRWALNGKAIKAENVTNGTYTFKETAPGVYKVQVFAEKDSTVQAEIEITVGAADLKEITFNGELKGLDNTTIALDDVNVTEDAKRYNKEELVLGTIVPNTGAALTASNVKFHIEPGKDLAKEDIKVVAEDVETKDGKKAILVKATTSKAGEFKVTPFVGEEFTGKDTVKPTTSFTVKTTVNTEVASISDVKFDAKDLKVGATPKAEIVIKNKHGEVLNADQVKGNVEVKSSKEEVATGNIVQGKKDVEGEDVNKTYLALNNLKEGTTVLTIQAGKVVKTVQVDVVGAELTTIKAEQSKVTGVKAGDAYSKEASENPVAAKAAYNKVSFLDQDGKEMTEVTNPIVTVKNATGKETEDFKAVLGEMKVDEKTEVVTFNADGKKSHVQLAPTKEVTKGTYTVEVSAKGKDGKDVKATFQVVVDNARAIDKVTVETKADTLSVGGTTDIIIKPTDQYGDFIEIDPTTGIVVKADGKVIKQPAGEVTPVKAKDSKGKETEEVIAYSVKAEAIAEGDGEVTVTIGDKTAKQALKVGPTSEVIEKVEIKEVEGVQNSSGDGVQLEAIVKDKNDKVVNVADEDLTWTIKGVKDAKGNVLKGTWNAEAGTFTLTADADKNIPAAVIKIADGKITTTDNPLGDLTVDVAVEVETVNFKVAETTVTIADAKAEYAKGFKVATVDNKEDFKGEGTEAEITTVDGVIFTFTGVDQYGEEFPIVDGVTATAGTASLKAEFEAGKSSEAGTLTITPVDGKGGKVYVKYGEERIELNITVAKEVAETLK